MSTPLPEPEDQLQARAAKNRHGKHYAERMTNRGELPWIGGSRLEWDRKPRPPVTKE